MLLFFSKFSELLFYWSDHGIFVHGFQKLFERFQRLVFDFYVLRLDQR